jgi:hypothetical protein
MLPLDSSCPTHLFRLIGDVMVIHSSFYAQAKREESFEGLKVGVKHMAKSKQPSEWTLVDMIAPKGDDEVESMVVIRKENFYINNGDDVYPK